jgi:hypothetical protein
LHSHHPTPSRFGPQFGARAGGWNDLGDGSSNSINEDEEYMDVDDAGENEWGLRKGMELFEVSAKDDSGMRPMSWLFHYRHLG